MAELRKLIEAQAATEAQLHQLQARSKEQYEEVEDQREVVEEIREALERAEMDVPPKGAPKPVGRQIQHGDQEATLGSMSFTDVLKFAKQKFFAEAGGTVSDVLSRRAIQGFDLIHSARHEIAEDRKAVEAQVADDRRKAVQLHKELNLSGVQTCDKRTRDDCTDVEGDELMAEAAGGLDAEEDAAGEPWQKVASRRKGKGGIRAPQDDPSASSSSAPAQRSASNVGPLATTPPSQVDAAARSDRDRSPRRSSAAGTPAAATDSGTLQPSASWRAARPPPVGTRPNVAADETPVAPTTPSPTRPPSDARPNVAQDETPAQLPVLSVTGMPSDERHTVDEEETPALDSLDSTPRASAGREEAETPFLIEPLQASGVSAAQDVAEPAGSGGSN